MKDRSTVTVYTLVWATWSTCGPRTLIEPVLLYVMSLFRCPRTLFCSPQGSVCLPRLVADAPASVSPRSPNTASVTSDFPKRLRVVPGGSMYYTPRSIGHWTSLYVNS
ncbi:hypothetical protein L226DRAFT_141083 [Lentinus tigrinus ALCF2SS1-7]|uniref:uncharacterized protein n=1 Tax=Lentinus tigrinus ALCF2SS1-7 TaxID=1328758 RepID=UPI001165E349|nr:hypothetical protein L226DRAFT_141083 [Lentinus tigrinus ALCF2SS1-7]